MVGSSIADTRTGLRTRAVDSGVLVLFTDQRDQYLAVVSQDVGSTEFPNGIGCRWSDII